jgi:3-oxoadipate enol-lactonase
MNNHTLHISSNGTTVPVNGTSLYCEDVGAGETILFSHGLLWNRTMFDAQVAALSSKFRCVAYDQRGHGLSSDHAGPIDIELLCDDTIALIEKRQLGGVHFLGHSLGGFVGIMLAYRRPDLVRSLILCNTSGGAEPPVKRFVYRGLNLAIKNYGPAFLAGSLRPRLMFGTSFLVSNNSSSKWAEWRQLIAANRPSIWRSGDATIHRPCQHNHLKSIKVPTLILTGSEDRLRTPAESQHLARSIADAKLICFNGGGHLLPLELPDLVSQAIADFLAAYSKVE